MCLHLMVEILVEDYLLQKCVSQYSTKVECMRIVEAKKKSIWLDIVIIEMRLKPYVIYIHCDNQSAIHIFLDANQLMYNILKHIDIWYHFLRYTIFDKNIELIKINV